MKIVNSQGLNIGLLGRIKFFWLHGSASRALGLKRIFRLVLPRMSLAILESRLFNAFSGTTTCRMYYLIKIVRVESLQSQRNSEIQFHSATEN